MKSASYCGIVCRARTTKGLARLFVDAGYLSAIPLKDSLLIDGNYVPVSKGGFGRSGFFFKKEEKAC